MTASSSESRRDFLKQTAAYAALAVPTASSIAARHLITSDRSALSAASGLTLVSQGRSTYAIVVLPGAPLAAQHGAEELQDHLKAMSGARLPIVAHDEVMAHRLPHGVTPGHFITLGAAPAHASLAEEAFHIQTQGTQLAITGGGTRGTLYGCYALLEDVLGVRWFTPQCTHIPTRPTITLPSLDLHGAPAMEYRAPDWTEMNENWEWALHNRVNCSGSLGARVGGKFKIGGGDFPGLFPPADYPQFWGGGQLCFSDPAVVPVAVAKMTALMRADRETRYWRMWPADGSSGCSCASCAAINTEEGANSGALLRFINAVADGIAPEFPHVVIEIQAYNEFENPPQVTRARPNVAIQLAILFACVAHAIGTCDLSKTHDRLTGWSKITDPNRLAMWHYSTNFKNYLQPLPNLTAMCGDFAILQRFGVINMYDQGDNYPGGGGSFAELKAYLQAKLMWNPACDGRALLQEFVTAVYGAGAPFIQQWIDAIEAEVVSGPCHDVRHAFVYDSPKAAGYLPESLLARGITLFGAAEQAAAQDPSALEQIRKARLALTYVQWQQAPAGSREQTRYEARVRDTMKHFGITTMRED